MALKYIEGLGASVRLDWQKISYKSETLNRMNILSFHIIPFVQDLYFPGNICKWIFSSAATRKCYSSFVLEKKLSKSSFFNKVGQKGIALYERLLD